MAYVKTTNGTVDTYPYSLGQLRRDNPNTSFPKQVPNDILASYGVYPVSYIDIPSIDERTQKREQETIPALIDDTWTIVWAVTDKTEDEIQQYDDSVVQSVRSTRDGLLSSSDWTQVPDAPVDQAAWATYRQALRDITAHENFPYLQNEDWPIKPE